MAKCCDETETKKKVFIDPADRKIQVLQDCSKIVLEHLFYYSAPPRGSSQH